MLNSLGRSEKIIFLNAGKHQEARTRLVLLALDPHPWSSVEDLAVESLPSSSSATYEKIAIGCFVISQPYVALQAISHCSTLVQTSRTAERKFSCRMEWVLPGCFRICLTVVRLLQLLQTLEISRPPNSIKCPSRAPGLIQQQVVLAARGEECPQGAVCQGYL